MVSADQFKRGVDLFFTQEVFPKLPEGKRFVAAFGTALILSGIEKHPMVQSLGLTAENGMMDVERAYGAAKTASKVAPLVLDLPIVGVMRFNAQDIDSLYNYITR